MGGAACRRRRGHRPAHGARQDGRALREGPSVPSTRAERYARYQATTPARCPGTSPSTPTGPWCSPPTSQSWTCWHATAVNGWTVGIEMAEADGTLYRPQLAAVVALCDVLCAHLHIDRRVPARNGVPIVGVVPRLTGQ